MSLSEYKPVDYDRTESARWWVLKALLAGLLLVASIAVQASGTDQFLPGALDGDEDPICEPTDLTLMLDGALLFAVDPAPSDPTLEKLSDRRPEHFYSLMFTYVIDDLSTQAADYSMTLTVAPRQQILAEFGERMLGLTRAVATSEDETHDVVWLWNELLAELPDATEDTMDWGCFMAAQADEQTINMVVGHGTETCAVVERFVDMDEALSMAENFGLTYLRLERVEGRSAAIRDSDLLAPVYVVAAVEFND